MTFNGHIRGFTTMRYINLRVTYLLTYINDHKENISYCYAFLKNCKRIFKMPVNFKNEIR